MKQMRNGSLKIFCVFASFAIIFFAICASRSDAADSRDMSARQYLSVLQKVRADLTSDMRSGGKKARTSVNEIRDCSVRAASGNLVYANNDPLAESIDRAEFNPDNRRARFQAALNRIDSLTNELSRKAPQLSPQAMNPKTATREEFSDVKFSSEILGPPQKSILDRIGDFVLKFLKKLHFHIKPMGGPNVSPFIWSVPAGFAKAFLYAVCIAAGGILVWCIAGLILSIRKTPAAKPDIVLESGIALTEEEQNLVSKSDFEGLMALAQKKALSGDYRSAFRLTYLASLVYLDSLEKIRLKRSLTNWECIAPLKENHFDAEFEIMQKQTRKFDSVWYGLNPAGNDDYRAAAAAFQSLQGLAGAPPA